jgi:FkbM family methyltransferase
MLSGRTLVSLFEKSLRLVLSRGRRAALGGYIADTANGDSNFDHDTNGEVALVRRFKEAAGANGAAPGRDVPPLVVFDVGANAGEWTRRLVSGGRGGPALGASATVYLFEPVRSTFDRLVANLEQIKSPAKFVPTLAALSDTDGEAPMFVVDDSEKNSLYRRHTEGMGLEFKESDVVRLVRGDTFCAERQIERIDFLKIDTEGNEIRVLNGFERMLSEKRVELLQFEYGGGWLDARTQLLDAFELLGRHGYTLAKVFPEGVRVHERYNQADETFRYANYVAFLPRWRDALNPLR